MKLRHTIVKTIHVGTDETHPAENVPDENLLRIIKEHYYPTGRVHTYFSLTGTGNLYRLEIGNHLYEITRRDVIYDTKIEDEGAEIRVTLTDTNGTPATPRKYRGVRAPSVRAQRRCTDTVSAFLSAVIEQAQQTSVHADAELSEREDAFLRRLFNHN